ncbi:MAG: hypothetical protein FWG35_08695 [Spirochaetaceae bacterium]|nr:hypothetical protein [Spirochaetaceae bacterium]
MWHPKTIEFTERLEKLFDEVDNYIEDVYGDRYSLHPARPARGATANPQADGLFTIGADFTAGYGSELGRGYLIDVTVATLEEVDESARDEIYRAAVRKIEELLPLRFPERELTVRQDGNHFKIQGDFGLGDL